MSKNRFVAEREPQRVQGEGAALVEPVVEHQLGPGSAMTRSWRNVRNRRQAVRACSSADGPPARSDHSHSA